MLSGAGVNVGALQRQYQRDLDRGTRCHKMHGQNIIDPSLKKRSSILNKNNILTKDLKIGPVEQAACKELNNILKADEQNESNNLSEVNLREKFLATSQKYPEDNALFMANIIRIAANIEEANKPLLSDDHDHKLSSALHDIAIEKGDLPEGQNLGMVLEEDDKRVAKHKEAENIIKNIDYEKMPLSIDFINNLKIPSIEKDGTYSYRPFKTINEFLECLRGFEKTTPLFTKIGHGNDEMYHAPSQILEFRLLKDRYADSMTGNKGGQEEKKTSDLDSKSDYLSDSCNDDDDRAPLLGENPLLGKTSLFGKMSLFGKKKTD